MDLEKLQRDLKNSYNSRFENVEKRVTDALTRMSEEWKIELDQLTLHEVKTVVTTILTMETQALHDEVETLLAQKEQIERSLEKKSDALQRAKYDVFNAIEEQFGSQNSEAIVKLHQVKLQSIDLFDILGEMVESAIITALEKDQERDIEETLEEIIKELTLEAIKEGSLNTIRVRKILSTILQSAVDVSEATPTRADAILGSVLKGMRSGLIHAIDRFKKRLVFMPVEAKHILIEDYETIIEDLNQTDVLFSQVIQTKASESSQAIRKSLLDIHKNMHYDLEELIHISKETAEVIRERFSVLAKTAMKRGEKALQSQTAREAKRMGIQAWSVARTALGTAIKSAKEVMDKKD
ncbi:MAG: hypothetical protein AUK54_03765 [Helicobacteraceae bacterium CG2_30_36_10]|nr:MAG: hypothetical protein AUK54_03765 [Helicobacteraceae bacterium CG2_30_36_10]